MPLKYRIALWLGRLLGFAMGLYDQTCIAVYKWRQWQDWTCVGYLVRDNQGVDAGKKMLRRMSLKTARAYVERHYGSVVHIDEQSGVIFFKVKE